MAPKQPDELHSTIEVRIKCWSCGSRSDAVVAVVVEVGGACHGSLGTLALAIREESESAGLPCLLCCCRHALLRRARALSGYVHKPLRFKAMEEGWAGGTVPKSRLSRAWDLSSPRWSPF